MKIYRSVSELIGNTPLVELVNFQKANGIKAHILAKLEYFNPAGSAKDRVALNMIKDAEEKGLLIKGGTVIEPTSGNTGIGLAAVGVSRGYRVIIVMPDTMSAERIKLIKAYGAEVILTDGKLGMSGAIAEANRLHSTIGGSIIAGQFTNPANFEAHIKSTGPEIFRDTGGNVSILVAGIGTGGTITGVGKYLKSELPDIKIIGVEPAASAILNGKNAAPHKLQGIGADFIPDILDTSIIDKVADIENEDAYSAVRELAKTEGILIGISSGAALCAAKAEAMKAENADKNIVVIFPDGADRYLSTDLFDIK